MSNRSRLFRRIKRWTARYWVGISPKGEKILQVHIRPNSKEYLADIRSGWSFYRDPSEWLELLIAPEIRFCWISSSGEREETA